MDECTGILQIFEEPLELITECNSFVLDDLLQYKKPEPFMLFIKRRKVMGKNFKRMTAFFLSLMMLVGLVATTAPARAAEETDNVQKGEFTFAPHTYMDGDLTDIYYYTDEVFSGSAYEYNAHLATMSMILASASISSQEKDAIYEVKSDNLRYLLEEWDFDGFAVNDHYMQKPEEQTMGVGMAYKVIGEGEKAYTLLAIVPRSAGYEKEWAGNFTVGVEGVHEGFATGRDIILDFAKQYVEENRNEFVGEVKVWTMGYSRGAGVANLLAAYLDDNSNVLGVETKKENIFAYTFGTPSTVQYADEEEKAELENNYKNIHNRFAAYDLIAFAPFRTWDFTCYGTSQLFDVENAERKAQMLKFLEKTNPAIYDIYTAENSAADPDNFMALMLDVNLTDGMSMALVPADPEYGIADNQAEFIESRIEFLTYNLIPDREVYVEDGYQYALQCLSSLYFGLDEEQRALLIEGMSHDATMMATVYYCYFVSDYYLNKANSLAFTAYIIIDMLPMIEEYMADADLSDGSEITAWLAFAYEFMQTPEYEMIKTQLPLVASGAEIAMDKIYEIRTVIENFAVGMTAAVLEDGISALTIDEEEKAELLATMTGEEVAAPLTQFLVYLLLGNEDGLSEPFNPGNKNIATAVTFFANAGRYMRVHNNEIILSWLRTEDSFYENEDWHIHQTMTKFDENGHWAECECGYKGEVNVHALSAWNTIPENDGQKDIVTRRCPCGYKESKDAPTTGDLTDSKTQQVQTTTIILVCIGSVVIIAAVVTMIVIARKRKHQN